MPPCWWTRTTSDSIVDGMRGVLDRSGAAAELRRKGLERAREFSWERSRAPRTLDVYRSAGSAAEAVAREVALVHDWLTGMRGGEKVLEALCELYPDADIFTLFHVRGSVSPTIERHRIHTSFVQRLPMARDAIPAIPAALPVRHRAVRPRRLRPGDQLQPLRRQVGRRAGARGTCATAIRRCGMRGISSTRISGRSGWARSASRWLYRPIMARLARWDAATAARAPLRRQLAHVAGRIRRYYNREATIVYPPVDTGLLPPAAVTRREPLS